MKLGFLTACLPQRSLNDCVSWAAENGFQALEVMCWPPGYNIPNQIDVNGLDSPTASAIRRRCDQAGIELTSLTLCANNLDPDESKQALLYDQLKKTIDAAELLGIATVTTFVGRDPRKTVAENLTLFGRLVPPLVSHAERHHVRLAIENCPMVGWQMEGLAGNIAYSPEIWRQMFKTVPSPSFGLNFDPSHLYWLGIDISRAVADFKERIFHVHAKDTEILAHQRATAGILGEGWWRYRVPGMGEINWPRFVSSLAEIGYDGVLSIEHEDPVWHGTEEKTKQGLVLGQRFLSPLLV